MKSKLFPLALIVPALALSACVPESSLDGASTASSLSGSTGPGGMRVGDANPAPPQNITEEEVRLGFLTAYINSDREMGRHYATPEAIVKLPWRANVTSYMPHYDDKGIFWFHGGLAHVTYGKVDGRNMITDFKVHYR